MHQITYISTIRGEPYMNKYGVVAIKAVELLSMVDQFEPLGAWNTAASDVFGEGSWSQRKVVPKMHSLVYVKMA